MATERGKSLKAKAEAPAPTEPKETNSITFEWPLRGLKQMFDSSKNDVKSKVIKSASFGGGRWTVLFYAQSGLDQFCSLYLNAEPLPHERQNPLLACIAPYGDSDKHRDSRHGGASRGSGSKSEGSVDDKWTRSGLFRFTFNIQAIEDKTILGTKEAHDHAFSHRTSNWGWAQFAKRDIVYYKNSDVIRDDAFLITVTITASSEKPKPAEPVMHAVPPALVHAMGSLLDDPEHSDVVFHLVPSKQRGSASLGHVRKVYAIRKILAARSDYFRLMFESGFQEGELENSSEEDELLSIGGADIDDVIDRDSPANLHRAHHAAARGKASSTVRAGTTTDTDLEDNSDYESDAQDFIFDDSDEEYGLPSDTRAHNDLAGPTESSKMGKLASGYNSPDGDGEGEGDDDDEAEEEMQSLGDDVPGSDEEVVGPSARTRAAVRRRVRHLKTASMEQDRDLFHPAAADFEEKAAPGSRASTSHGKHAEDSEQSNATHSSRGNVSDDESTDADLVAHETSTKASSLMLPPKSGKSERVHRLRNRGSRGTLQGHTPADRRKRRKVTVMDSAYPTFKALLYFLYTDTIEFAPLTSSFLPPHIAADDRTDSIFTSSDGKTSGSYTAEMRNAHHKRRAVIEEFQELHPNRPAPCSAKAMYRLADKLDIPDLKRRAQEHIAVSLTTDNIVWEVFSGFNTQYPDIRKMETDFLLKHWPQVKRSSAMKSIFSRSSAHPGLAEVWPHLLEFLEYKQPDASSEASDGVF